MKKCLKIMKILKKTMLEQLNIESKAFDIEINLSKTKTTFNHLIDKKTGHNDQRNAGEDDL